MCIFNQSGSVVLMLLFVLTFASGSQSKSSGQSVTPENKVNGYWVDPATGLIWAGKDNGKKVNWQTAKKYCLKLRLDGYSNWTLATIDELRGIYDKTAEAPGINPPSHWHGAEPINYHVKGNLFLNGDQWSSSQRIDDRGHPGLVWYFDFINGVQKDDDTTLLINLWGGTANALCVRRP